MPRIKTRNCVFFFLLLFVLNSGCSNIRMRYHADLDVSGKKAQFSYERSYALGKTIPILCLLTATIFGGSCWYYFLLPTADQKKQTEADAQIALEKALGGKSYEISACTNDRVGWSNDPEGVSLNY